MSRQKLQDRVLLNLSWESLAPWEEEEEEEEEVEVTLDSPAGEVDYFGSDERASLEMLCGSVQLELSE
ncbi:hypothetical protein BTVI_99242 [Pitangus sulphuratus]|nr:hypothetical protein BTVI_99242 [Pitangus sulphuratus]